MFRDHIQKLVQELSLEGETNLPQNLEAFSLQIDGVAVTLYDRAPGIEYSATLGTLQEEKREELFKKLLRGNFLGQATRKSYLGLDETGQNVTVTMFIPIVRSFREFRDLLEDFSNVISFWKTAVPYK